jgi:hypothetical protein
MGSTVTIVRRLSALAPVLLACTMFHPEWGPASDRWRKFDHPTLPVSFDAPENMRTTGDPNATFGKSRIGLPLLSRLGDPKDRSGSPVLAQSWTVHALRRFPELDFALTMGFWWLTPNAYALEHAEIARLAASIGEPGVALRFLLAHLQGDQERVEGAIELGAVRVDGRLGRRIGFGQPRLTEYVVVPVRERGVLVACASFGRGAHVEREQIWPRILASIRLRQEVELERAD